MLSDGTSDRAGHRARGHRRDPQRRAGRCRRPGRRQRDPGRRRSAHQPSGGLRGRRRGQRSSTRVLGTRIRVEHWQNAISQGRAAAHALLGEPVSYEDLPYFFSDQYDLGMEFFGHAAGADDVQVEPGESDDAFSCWWRRDGRAGRRDARQPVGPQRRAPRARVASGAVSRAVSSRRGGRPGPSGSAPRRRSGGGNSRDQLGEVAGRQLDAARGLVVVVAAGTPIGRPGRRGGWRTAGCAPPARCG